jgi:two-component system, cell cycle sensor histidine kinase and response regulator CckA
MARVLVVDEAAKVCRELVRYLTDDGHDASTRNNGRALLDLLRDREFDIVVTDFGMPPMNGLDLLARIKSVRPTVKVVLMAAEPSFETATEAIRAGAFDFLIKPVNRAAVCRVVRSASRIKALEDENREYREHLEELVRQRTQQLRESEGKYKAISEQSLTGILIHREGRLTYVNPRLVSLLGYDESETSTLIDQPVTRFVHPADRSRVEDYIRRRLRGEAPPRSYELRLITKRGETVWVEVLISTIEGQDPPALLVHLINVTDRKEAEEEKAKLEEQLRQSQKMEAIGRLAGGVAHDFNNLLTAIQGYSEMMLLSLPANDPLRSDTLQIKKAADRATSLTQQLLAFSRKQNIEPRLVDLNRQLREARDMLGRVIGEDIRLTLDLSPAEAVIKVDPHQIDQVLLNLVANARDAMSDGGHIEISTRRVTRRGHGQSYLPRGPGDDFVCLTVRDDGEGMDESTRKRIFEPFFTTKEKGKGTGLGLATVYGIVTQNRGAINVQSAPGEGAQFEVFFPAARGKPPVEPAPVKDRLPRGRGTILLVEDEEMVRSLAQKVLASAGYRVLEAPSGGDALVTSEKFKTDIHLLLTDVIMPNMNGKELFHRLRTERPELRVLYMSGYTEDVIAHHGIVEEGIPFLQKPFSIESLSRKVADVMRRDQPSS